MSATQTPQPKGDRIASILAELGACSEARQWAASLPDGTTPAQAWAACERGDWLLWLATKAGVDRRIVVCAACACARPALSLWEARFPRDQRPRVAIETAEAWSRGEVSLGAVRAAARDAAYAYAAHAAGDAYAAAAAAAAVQSVTFQRAS